MCPLAVLCICLCYGTCIAQVVGSLRAALATTKPQGVEPLLAMQTMHAGHARGSSQLCPILPCVSGVAASVQVCGGQRVGGSLGRSPSSFLPPLPPPLGRPVSLR